MLCLIIARKHIIMKLTIWIFTWIFYIYNFRPFASPSKCRPVRSAPSSLGHCVTDRLWFCRPHTDFWFHFCFDSIVLTDPRLELTYVLRMLDRVATVDVHIFLDLNNVARWTDFLINANIDTWALFVFRCTAGFVFVASALCLNPNLLHLS